MCAYNLYVMTCLGVGIRACYKTAPFKTIKYIYQNTCFVTFGEDKNSLVYI